MSLFNDLSTLTGYDQYGDEWDSNIGQAGYWDPKTQAGRSNWTNWMKAAGEEDWASLAEKTGRDASTISEEFTGAFGSSGTPQIYQPENFPTAYEGLGNDYIGQIMNSVMPSLQSSVEGYDQNVDTYTKEAMARTRSGSKDLLDSVLQTSLNSLGNRNILNSSIASNTMGAATGDVMKNLANQNMQANMTGAQLKVQAPDMLSQVANLGKYSEKKDPSVPQQILSKSTIGLS